MATPSTRKRTFHELSTDCEWPAALRTIHRLADAAHTLASELDDLESAAHNAVLAQGGVPFSARALTLAVREVAHSRAAEQARRVVASLDILGDSQLRDWRADRDARAGDTHAGES